jgi:hypothetical protein
MNVSDTVTWMKLKGIRRTGYNSHTHTHRLPSMTGKQNYFEKEVMDIQVTSTEGVWNSQHT